MEPVLQTKQNEPVFDEAMRAKIIDRAKESEKNPKQEKDFFQLVEEIQASL